MVIKRIMKMNRASLLMMWRHCVLEAYRYLQFKQL